jgi:hypothetical protein
MCGMHHARGDEKSEFLGSASKPRSTVCQWFGLKITRTVCQWFGLKTIEMIFSGLTLKPWRQRLPVWPQNWWLRVFWFGPQDRQLRFDDLGLKITTVVSWFGPQNQADYGLLVASQNRREGNGVGHASKSSGLLHVEASWARVSQSVLKTGGGAMTGGIRGIITEVASRSS